MDPHVFFMVLFGSGKFEPFVGKLRLASKVETAFEGESVELEQLLGDADMQKTLQLKMDDVQQEREVRGKVKK